MDVGQNLNSACEKLCRHDVSYFLHSVTALVTAD